MRWYVSYPVLAAGLAFGLETFFPSAPDLSRPTVAEIRLMTAERSGGPVVVAASDLVAQPASRVGAFSPGARLLAAERPRPPTGSVLDYLTQTLAPSQSPPAEAAPIAPVTVAEWKSAIVRDWQPTVAPAATPRENEAVTRVALARDIQRELQRVGCYLGEIDGVWGGGSQRAVVAFMDRVNASLPTQEPDVFMLSLLRGQTSAVCGTSCPRGQSPTAGGRCMPPTLVVQADESAPSRGLWEPTVAEATPEHRSVPYGRMSIGGPRLEDVSQMSDGGARLTGAPRGADPRARTAALDVAPDEAAADGAPTPEVAASSFDTDAVPQVRRKKSAGASKAKARPERRWKSSYRQVQHLFTHPLGRM